MKITRRFIFLFLFLTFGACRSIETENMDFHHLVATEVAAKIAALPTLTLAPVPTPYPTPTLMSLTGLFCEYSFCIGHPQHVIPFDLNAADTRVPGNFSSGKLVGYSDDLLLLILWQMGVTDLQYMLSAISQASGGTLTGSLDIRLVGPYNVYFQPIQPPPTSALPYGGAAAWVCGDRAFAWLVYTAQDGITPGLLDMALNKFTCGED